MTNAAELPAPDPIPVVIVSTGAVEYLPASTPATWDGWRGSLGDVLSHFLDRPFHTLVSYPIVLGDGRAVLFEGWRNEALRLREEVARLRTLVDAERALRLCAVEVGGHDEGCWCDGCARHGAAEEALLAAGGES